MVGSHMYDYLYNSDIELHGLLRWRSPLDNLRHSNDNFNNKKDPIFIMVI